MYRLPLSFACACWMLCGQAPGTAAVTHENLNALVWMQTSAEYHATALGVYRAAEASMMRALADETWTAAVERGFDFRKLPPAIILDLDETVLDNSAFMARLIAGEQTYSEAAWQAWVNESAAGLLPGSLQFLTVAHAHGITPFYVTNRVCNAKDPNDPTRLLLIRHALPMTGELLCKESASASSDKSPRRNRVAMTHRILLLLGDDFNDFVAASKEQATIAGRHSLAEGYGRYWGERWFVLPNPTYGSWERATGYTVEEKRKLLRTGR